MDRRAFLFVTAAGAVAACAPLPNTNPISREVRAGLTFSSVEVSTSGTAFESTRAADYSSRLASDLKAMIEREFVDRMDPGGVTLMVDVSRFNVAGSTTTAFGRDQSLLQGAARVLDNNDNVLGAYTVQVVAGQAAGSTAGALWDAATSSGGGYYRDLLDEFARDVREEILGGDLPGARLLRQITN